MKIVTGFKLSMLGLVVFFLSACNTMAPRDQSAMMQARPRSILVIPPLNNSVEVNASYTFVSTITRPLAEKGYYVFPVAVIDLFMKENGLPTPGEMNSVPLDKIREHIAPDAVLYTEITNWGQKFEGIASRAVVSANLRLVDARNGNVLWSGRAYAQQSGSNNSDAGIAGMVFGAIVDHVIGSIADHTYELSRQANSSLIRSQSQGLIDGPYRLELAPQI